MNDFVKRYRSGQQEIPAAMKAWQVFGAGLENFGRDEQPVEIEVPQPGPRELLARVDAAGLCFSDVKILRLGGEHLRLYGRDLAADPIILGHEAALTIVKVGSDIADQFSIGDRFVVQADIFYQGVNLAFGYMLPGALEQYVLLGKEILEGDEGLYLLPVQPETGYAETALSEPWACVIHAYRTDFRRRLAPGGVAWFVGSENPEVYSLGTLAQEEEGPDKILYTGISEQLREELAAAAQQWGAQLQEVPSAARGMIDDLKGEVAPDGFNDIILLGQPVPELVEAASAALGREGALVLVTDEPLVRPVEIDLGRIHYDYIRYLGCQGPDISEAYSASRNPRLAADGKALIVGGGGPMGQMHVQLALESPDGPQVVVATDIALDRLSVVAEQLVPVADELGKQLICLNPEELGQETFDRRLREIATDGFDDVVVMVPVASLAVQAAQYVADGGVVNFFAGMQRGTMGQIDLSSVALDGVRYTGTSGSRIHDLEATLHMTESGQLSPNRSVGAIGGIEAAREGMGAVQDGEVPGKIVIYPQIEGLPLTRLDELDKRLPDVAEKLGPGNGWTNEAEIALLEHFLR